MTHRLDLLYWHGYRRPAHRPDVQLCWAAFYPALVHRNRVPLVIARVDRP